MPLPSPRPPLAPLLSALLVSTALVAPARAAAPAVFSPAWFAARSAARSAGAATAAAARAATGASLASVQQSITNLQRASQAIIAAQAGQQAARSAAYALPATVPDGLVAGGLQPLPGVTPGDTLWQGANLPVQSGAALHPTVTVQQTARQAVLTWQTFNVGRNTHLAFDQSAGGGAANTWVVLNRISDPYQLPSQILGSITAPGQVLVINRNGVIFGATAQVNTGALIASAADINSAGFLQNGIYSSSPTSPAFTGAAGPIIVQPGAQISLNVPPAANTGGGFALLLGNKVVNGGAISAPGGQVAMAAGRDFVVRAGFGNSNNADSQATVLGNQVAVTANGGAVSNTGLLQASDGDITMVGHTVTQAGVIATSTGLGQRGTVHLLTDTADLGATVTLAPGSVTAITIDSSNTTGLEALRAAVQPTGGVDSSGLNNRAGLPDFGDLSRIEITSGGAVAFGAGALALATSGQIAVAANGTVLMAPGASADVAGLVGVALPQSANLFPVTIEPNNLRDSPVNRDTTLLNSASITVDARTLLYVPPQNGDASARYYTGGGLLEVSGELGNVGHTIAEYSTTGGTVDIQAPTVITQPGSGINVAGGSTTYAAGPVAQTWLLGADGRLVNLNNATDTEVYTGVFTGFSESHPHWGVTETFQNPLIAPATIEEAAYTVGHDAGSIIIGPPASQRLATLALAGTIAAGTVVGERQNKQATSGETGLLVTQQVVPSGGTLDVAAAAFLQAGGSTPASISFNPILSDVTIEPTAPATQSLTLHGRVPRMLQGKVTLGADMLDQSGLGALLVFTNTSIAVTGSLAVADGGSITLQAPVLQVAAPIVARGGAVTLGGPSSIFAGKGVAGNPHITIAATALIDTRGVWTNALLAPQATSGEAYINGGAVTVQSLGSITLAAGAGIDASAGGYVTTSGSVTGGAGGNITLQADLPAIGSVLPVTPGPSRRNVLALDGSIRSVGFTQGGTLTLQAPGIAIGDGLRPAYPGELVLSPALFASGFSNYVLVSATGVRIVPGAQVNVVEPVYQATTLSASIPGGSDPDAAFQVVLPPLFFPDPLRARLTQRAGASITLDAPGETITTKSSQPPGPTLPYGDITLGAGAAIRVDPGRSAILDGSLAVTVQGTISAPGGTIEVLDTDTNANGGAINQILGNAELWIGPTARLDAAGIAATATDLQGRAYGTVTPGGSIVLGNTAGFNSTTQLQNATDAPIVIVPGATLDASGAVAAIDLGAGLERTDTEVAGVVADATGGGTISLASYTTILPNGTLRAAAGGSSAAGGTLDLVLETGLYGGAFHFPGGQVPAAEDPYLKLRTIIVGAKQSRAPAAASRPGRGALLPVGTVEIAPATISAGGFGTVSLYARDAIVFRGNVALSVAQAVTLDTDALASSTNRGLARVSAPYVLLAGSPNRTQGTILAPYEQVPGTTTTKSTLDISAALIDVQGEVVTGASGPLQIQNSSGIYGQAFLPGLKQLSLQSTGDIRFLLNAGSNPVSSLQSDQSISLAAAQVYPVTGAVGEVYAGLFQFTYEFGSSPHVVVFDNPHATLTIARTPGTDPAPPLSAFGQLALSAPTIDQGGILRAPFGELAIGATPVASGSVTTTRVNFLPGSITSVSPAGASIPYGGTTDGITYTYQGGTVTFSYGTNSGTVNSPLSYGITVAGQAVSVAAGATVDLQGGGTLTGAGFVSGRGGSTDTLLSPLLGFSAGVVSAPTLGTGDAVYALLPSVGTGYAQPAQPNAGSTTGSLPGIGQTVTVGAGIPGLPAGTYTLLPSYYALQAGGYRIELRGSTAAPLTGTEALPNGSYLAAVQTGLANTGVLSAVPVSAIITPAASVRRYSQYDEQSYAAFAVARPSVSVFGQFRPTLPQDAGELDLVFGPNLPRAPAFTNAGIEMLAPAAGGYGGTLAVYTANTIDSLTIGTPRTDAPASTVVDAAALDAVDPANMVIGGIENGRGGTLTPPQSIDIFGAVSALTIAPGASLAAPQVFLASAGSLTIDRRATIDTVGRTGSVLDSSSGLQFGLIGNSSVVAVSEGSLLFQPVIASTATSTGIAIGSGATLFAAGSLALVSSRPITLSPNAAIGAASFDVTATTINVGTPGQIPMSAAKSGFLLSQQLLATLLNGDPGAGVPALQTLDLTATQSLNFYGAAQLNAVDPATGQSRLGLFVLNTPGIYGLGGAGDTAVLNVGTLYWNGVASIGAPSSTTQQQTVTVNPPPLVSPGGPGTGLGTLEIDARQIVFGPGPNDTPQSIASEPRAILGFSTVNLNASQQITAAQLSTLTVNQTQGLRQPDGTFAGSGGALHIATPLLTAASNGSLDISVGGALTLAPGIGALPGTARPDAAGGEIGLSAASIDDATAIVIPSGRVLLSASGDVTLEPGARIDVAGEDHPIFDQTVSGPGGAVSLSSSGGNVLALPGSAVAFGGTGNQAGGGLSVQAAQGTADVAAALTGGGVDAADSGGFTLDARVLPSFAALNQALTAGGIFGSRRFEIGSGDLSIETTDQLRAQNISVSVDAGGLTVDGLVDASGAKVGTIALAGGAGLALTAKATLAAQGSVLVADSYGAAIDAANRAEISLTAAAGTLSLAPGATVALDSADGIARGDLELNAPRASATGAGIGVSAPGSLAITGAATIALNGFWSYHPADGLIVQTNLGAHGRPIHPLSIGLDQINRDSQAFETAALASGAVASADAGLSAYGAAFHLRPGVVIDSAATGNGNLSVDGDLNLAAFRYGPNATGNGAGEPGVLVLRASGDLGVYGSISDGFGTPPTTPDQAGWTLANSSKLGTILTSATTVLTGVTLAAGTVFANNDVALGYPVALQGGTINAAMAVPVGVTLADPVPLSQDWTTTAALTISGHTVPAGHTLRKGQTLPVGTVLAAGSTLPQTFVVGAIGTLGPNGPIGDWPATASLAIFASPVTLASATVPLSAGQTIPGGTIVNLPGGVKSVPTRPTTGRQGAQGQIDALAAMLPAGSLSWSLGLVAGANLGGADNGALLPLSQLASAGSSTTSGDLLLDDPHFGALSATNGRQGPLGYSVIRTGTGSLSLAAGGSIEQQSPYGLYTAGTQASGVSRSDEPKAVTSAGVSGGTAYQDVARRQVREGYQPYYPTDGGDLLVAAQGSVATFYGGAGGFFGSGPGDLSLPSGGTESATLGWLWQQGTTGHLASYWINFGSYQQSDELSPSGRVVPAIVGFTGFGTLGGGNLSLNAGGDIGAVADPLVPFADGLVAAVASSGRVTSVQQSGTVVSGGTIAQTGGGDLTLRIGGAVLGADTQGVISPGLLTNIRGRIDVSAGSVGLVQPVYGSSTNDPRLVTSVTNAETAYINDGITLAIGDSVASVTTRGDLSLADAVDPGRVGDNFFVVPGSSSRTANVRYTGFSLWQANSGIDILSAGGNVSPNSDGIFAQGNTALESIFIDEYPSVLAAAAQHGSLYFAANEASSGLPIELTPSSAGNLSLLAAQSIYGPGVISVSGAPAGVNDLPNPFKPAYQVSNGSNLVGNQTNVTDAVLLGNGGGGYATSLYPFESDTPTAPLQSAGAPSIRAYAGSGDIVDLTIGQVTNEGSSSGLAVNWYSGTLPTRVIAARDLVDFGQPGNGASFGATSGLVASAGLFVNDYAGDISVLQAGRNIIYASADVAGPGLLYVQAGRDVYQGVDNTNTAEPLSGVLTSLGQQVVNASIPPSDSTGGAAITVLAGVGSAGPAYTAFANQYFNDANLANTNLLLTDPANAGKVQQTYGAQLLAWLQQNTGYTGDQAGALAAFLALPVERQSEFTLLIYFDELRLSGRQFTDPTSRFYKSYARGKQAIATLFPGADYNGGVTLFALPNTIGAGGTIAIQPASAITTNYGGAITVLAPGGAVTLGTTTPGPYGFGSPYGVLTFGQGDIDIYSLGSVLLGTSRIFTTFGGGITIWSAQGDINAGQGTKSAVVAQPFTLAYDLYGNVTLSPQEPSTGAGIATLNEIPGTAPGDVDLIAPQGTIDAGEAGIRSSGNANLAALAISNAANIQVQGKTTGVPVIAAPNIGALNAAAAVSSAAQNSALAAATKQQAATTGSIITVEVLGFGG